MKKEKPNFQVTVPTSIFRILGIIYFVISILLSIFFGVRCNGIQKDLQIFCICLFVIGLLFFFANYIWHVDFYKDYFKIYKLFFFKKIYVCNVEKIRITDTRKIQICNKNKIVASIDINCTNYKKVIQYFKKNGVQILEECIESN